MKRLIPSQIKEESTIIKGLTAKDIVIIVIGLFLVVLMLQTSLPSPVKSALALVIAAVFIVAVVPFDMVRGYKILYYWFLFITRKRKIDNVDIEEAFELKFSDTIENKYGHSAVVQLHGIDFGIFEERSQDDYINSFCEAVKEVKNGKLIKLEKPLDLTKYIEYNNELVLQNLERQEQDAEAVAVRNEILNNQNSRLEIVNYDERVDVEAYYFVICDENAEACLHTAEYVASVCKQIGLAPKILKGRELKLFVKLFFALSTEGYDEYDEKQGADEDKIKFDFIQEKANKIVFNTKEMRVMCLGRYPYFVGNAWAHDIYSIEGCKVCFNFCTYNGKNVNKVISKSMTELRTRLRDEKLREDERMGYATSYNSLESLLEELNYANEVLYYTECYIYYPAYRQREITKAIRAKGIRTNDLLFTQYDGWLSMLPFIPMPAKENKERFSPIQSSSIAAAFPFVAKQLMDDRGRYLGFTSRYPAFFNQFELSETRVNHNMVIFGKTGGGKSFTMKKLVVGAAVEGKKIYLLDPDNEYDHCCRVLGGNWIDVGGETSGRMNPLQVFPSLREGTMAGSVGDVSAHRLFLDQFFRTILPDMSEECLLFLNKAIADMYASRRITDEVDLKALSPSDFPIFDDLKALIAHKVENKENRYDEGEIAVYKKVLLYVEQFADGGLYARMWNGYTTLEISNDFNVLNFQSLFANNNRIVANGQMLLLMRFLNQEVIKNREYNKTAEVPKEIMIVIDEAHRFINPQFPVALDFMSTMGKQIRKYKGALMVATQNIDDFVGVSPEMKAQASAVINACQYSMIFGLFADDINKVKELYANYNGGLTQSEVDYITKARRGDALFIVDINTRLPIHVEVFAGEFEYLEPIKADESLKDAKEVKNNE